MVSEQPFLSLTLDEAGDLRGQKDADSGEFRCFQLEKILAQMDERDLAMFYSLADAFTEANGNKKTN